MSYGVTKTWAAPRSRARAATSSKRKTTKTVKKSSRVSVPRAKKPKKRKTSKASTAKRTAKKPRAKRAAKAKKPKAPKTYKRYDPVTGALAKVTKDDPRYDEWRTTKGTVASRKKKLLKEDPLEYAQTFGVSAVKKRAERAVSTTVSKAARKVSAPVGAALAPTLARLAPFAIPAVITAGTVAAGVAAYMALARNERKSAGERINEISREFAEHQAEVVKQLRVANWQAVPAELRTKLVNGYKAAITEVASGIYQQGSLRPSQQIPYGR